MAKFAANYTIGAVKDKVRLNGMSGGSVVQFCPLPAFSQLGPEPGWEAAGEGPKKGFFRRGCAPPGLPL